MIIIKMYDVVAVKYPKITAKSTSQKPLFSAYFVNWATEIYAPLQLTRVVCGEGGGG